MYRIGIDIGSTTIKCVVLDITDNQIFKEYRRHNAKIRETLLELMGDIYGKIGDDHPVSIGLTGSIGMGVAEKCGFPFVQEVVAATKAISHRGLKVSTMIDIGGEDAKVVFFNARGEAVDLRMNGNCAGGTGAFIDQMTLILSEEIGTLCSLAENSTRIYPIASRCGVFSKTDVQNLVAKGIPKEDIAASIFRAVVIQTVVTLAHGAEIKAPVLFCGGPLTFIPALRKAYRDYLKLDESDVVMPEDGQLLPALGTAVAHKSDSLFKMSEIMDIVRKSLTVGMTESRLPPLFKDEADRLRWAERVCNGDSGQVRMPEG
ncbi:MAG: BadF/BadG/BcrA/BcrD ATPase family protein, partial [Candidatus Cryptobacteroides sp.]